jgi:DNA-binding transcriptional LysR family regulator
VHAPVLKVCPAPGFDPRVVQTSREMYTTVSLVEAEMGVTIIPASVRRLGWRGVRYFPIRSESAMTRIDATWRVDNNSPVIPAFLEIARAVVRS